MPKLTVKQIEALVKPDRYSDGNGLYLEVDKAGSRRWMYRYQLNGKRTWHGLGGYHPKTNSLAMARDNALKCKLLVSQGIHPTDAVKKQKAELKALEDQKRQTIVTFEMCADEWYERNESGWTNPKHRQQIKNTLRDYVIPYIGSLPVADVSITDIRKCLDPIWDTKTETASRVRQRLEAVFAFAIVSGYRTDQNPAQWRGYLDQVYVNPETVKRNKNLADGTDGHMNALPYADAPAFMSELNRQDAISAKALEFTILTGSRTKPVRFMKWNQIDWEAETWTIPANLMKTKREFKVALSSAALAILQHLPRVTDYVFPGGKAGQPMSENAMLKLLERMNRSEITVHGFRSTFRDWVGEETEFDTQLAEYALSHKLPNVTERAYARGDQLEKRFKLMEAWRVYLFNELHNVRST
ncbi:integrase arm-type DNA-binding domain-containing protein [Litoricolaceae bacterium]|nr:integrase arm-type DNA-binding domain-containing protein [Litorivicinaceae bacterium]